MNKTIKKIRHTLHPLRQQFDQMLALLFPKYMAGVLYKRAFHEPLNWTNPTNINEKINWLKFNSDTTIWTRLADKYLVRQYIEEKGLGHILVDLYGKWDKSEDIDWDNLPNSFVMKTNNGSGDILVCKDKQQLNTKEWTKTFAKLLKVKYGTLVAEPHYNKMKPCIIAEELLDNTTQPIPTTSLIDYKIWAFDGKSAYIWACHNRTHDTADVMLYDLSWTAHPEYCVSTHHHHRSETLIPRPACLDEMLTIASSLSKGFPQMRVDLYEVNGKIYFGELTLTSAAGFNDFYTKDFLQTLGSMVTLPNKK